MIDCIIEDEGVEEMIDGMGSGRAEVARLIVLRFGFGRRCFFAGGRTVGSMVSRIGSIVAIVVVAGESVLTTSLSLIDGAALFSSAAGVSEEGAAVVFSSAASVVEKRLLIRKTPKITAAAKTATPAIIILAIDLSGLGKTFFMSGEDQEGDVER